MKSHLSIIQKNCKAGILILLLLFTGTGIGMSQNNESLNSAFRYLVKNIWIYDSLKANRLDPQFAIAIVFPELIRYSLVQDRIETGGLFSLYVNYGKKYADFSVGRFQMKPSFAEQIENDSRRLKQKTYFKTLPDNASARLARVKRLDNPVWQVRYLVYFIRIMETKYAGRIWKNMEEKVRFFSAAYNCGYTLPEKEIFRKATLKTFHTGVIKTGEGLCYSDISCKFYSRADLK